MRSRARRFSVTPRGREVATTEPIAGQTLFQLVSAGLLVLLYSWLVLLLSCMALGLVAGVHTLALLGGIGGTAFTPIVNWPEVAILGMSRSSLQPVVRDGQIVPRLMLPLSLTYDHRVIDGAYATRFNVYLAQLLADFRRVAL